MRTPTRLADQWKRVAKASSAHSGRAPAVAWHLDRQFAAFEQARLLGRILRLRSVRTRLRGQSLVRHLLGKFETQESATAAGCHAHRILGGHGFGEHGRPICTAKIVAAPFALMSMAFRVGTEQVLEPRPSFVRHQARLPHAASGTSDIHGISATTSNCAD
jgi:hypothetical protein